MTQSHERHFPPIRLIGMSSARREVASYRSVNVGVEVGDVARVSADALISPVNSERMWFGGVDGAISRAAGGGFHRQASQYLDNHSQASDGEAIFADGARVPQDPARSPRAFKNVIFVVDDLRLPLSQIVRAGVQEAYARGMQSVTLPLMRSGIMAGVVEKTEADVAREMMQGIKNAADVNPGKKLKVTVVVYGDSDGSRSAVLQQAAQNTFGRVV